MQGKNNGKSARTTQSARTNSGQGYIKPGKNGSEQTDTGTPPGGILRIHLLERELKTIPHLYAVMCGGGKRDSQAAIQLIDTEEKLLQAIRDLYLIVKAQPKYKAQKEKQWDPDTPPLAVLHWLLRKLGPLAKGDPWMIDTYQERGQTRYQFVVYRTYHRQKLLPETAYVALDFLPMLKSRDQLLHDIIVDLVALVSKYNKIPLWDEDEEYAAELKNLTSLEISPTFSNKLRRHIMSYKAGPAAMYLKLLKQRRRVVTPELLKQQLRKYDCTSQRKRSVAHWVKYGISLAEERQNLKPFTFYPSYAPANAVIPSRLYKFIWSAHRKDILNIKIFKKIRDDRDKAGLYVPVTYTVTRPGNLVDPISHFVHEFPVRLFYFMSEGEKIFESRYREYFYKNQLDEEQTPMEALLEKIEILEFK